MPVIKINNAELTFDNVYYCDSNNGNDSNSGLSDTSALKTIQAAINKIPINTNSAIVLLPNSIFSGAVPSTGLVNISANKQITFIGRLLNYDVSSMPIISSADNNCIQNNSSKEINFINIRIESLGSVSTGGASNYAILCHSTISGANVNFYNCYLKPRGVMFLSYYTYKFYNSIIDYNTHSFQYEIFSSANSLTFYNSIVLGTMTCRTTYSSGTGIFYNSIVPSSNLSFHNFNSTTNKRMTTSLSTIDNNYFPTIDPIYYKNQGTGYNPDGSIAHIGIYGGPYALGI